MGGQFIDTPGEYLERVRMRGALSVTAADADIILFVQDPTAKEKMFPPAYAGSFAKPVVGIVTKSDIATEEQLKDATEHLKAAGANHIFGIIRPAITTWRGSSSSLNSALISVLNALVGNSAAGYVKADQR